MVSAIHGHLLVCKFIRQTMLISHEMNGVPVRAAQGLQANSRKSEHVQLAVCCWFSQGRRGPGWRCEGDSVYGSTCKGQRPRPQWLCVELRSPRDFSTSPKSRKKPPQGTTYETVMSMIAHVSVHHSSRPKMAVRPAEPWQARTFATSCRKRVDFLYLAPLSVV